MTVVLMLLVILSVVSTASAQFGSPVTSPLPAALITTLPPAWLALGRNGRLIARLKASAECPTFTVNGVDVPMTRQAQASEAFRVVTCEATVPFGT